MLVYFMSTFSANFQVLYMMNWMWNDLDILGLFYAILGTNQSFIKTFSSENNHFIYIFFFLNTQD